MKVTGPCTSLVTPKLPKVENLLKEMFGLAYPNDKNWVLRHCNQCYDLVRNAKKFFFIQKCSLRCTG